VHSLSARISENTFIMGKVNITDEVKRKIKDLREEGLSYSQIGERLSLSKCTVARWVKRFKECCHGNTPVTKKSSGRPRKTSPATERLMKRCVQDQPSISARELRAQNPQVLGEVSVRTIQERLQKDLGLPSRRPAPKPLLTAKMKAKRLAFCRRYANWTAEDWSKVMFSDESKFLTFSQRHQSVRRPRGSDRFDPKYTRKTVKHPAGIMVWGAFSAHGRGPLYFLEPGKTMTGVRYIQTLESQHLTTHMEVCGCTIFMQDNAPCHTSRVAKAWFEDKGIEVLDWPGNSPDLNPIENLWHIAKMKLQKMDTSSNPKLQSAIKSMWLKDMDRDYCKRLVHSMPRRIRAVLKAKGNMTKY